MGCGASAPQAKYTVTGHVDSRLLNQEQGLKSDAWHLSQEVPVAAILAPRPSLTEPEIMQVAKTKFLEHAVLVQETFVQMLPSLGMNIDKAAAEKLFTEIDVDGGGTLDVDEFSAWYAGLKNLEKLCRDAKGSKAYAQSEGETSAGSEEDKFAISECSMVPNEGNLLQEAKGKFAEHDPGNGELDKEAFARLLPSLGMQIDKQAAYKLFTEIDVDGGGTVDVDEFSAWYAGLPYSEKFYRDAPGSTDENQFLQDAQGKFAKPDPGSGEFEMLPSVGMLIDQEAECMFAKHDLRCKFAKLDPGNGELDHATFAKMLPSLGMEIDSAAAEKLFTEIDVDGGGTLDVDEFSAWYAKLQYAEKWFREADADANGELDLKSFTAFFRKLGLDDETEAEHLFTEIDIDGGGTVDMTEFALWCSTSEFCLGRLAEISPATELAYW